MALVRRCVGAVLLAVATASFGYLLAAAGLDARSHFEGRSPAPAPAVVEAQLDAVNLNDRTPLAVRYRRWASGIVRGDLGRTWDGAPVAAELWPRLLVSLRLLLAGTVLGAVAGVVLAVLAVLRPWAGRLLTGCSLPLLAVPVFVLAVLLQLAARSSGLGIEWVGEGEGAAGRLEHLVLPTLTVALGQIALYGRYQRTLLRDVLESEHVRAARARGLTRRRALLRHGLPLTLVPTSAAFAYNLGLLLLGAVFLEKIYGWHGMGELLTDALRTSDVNTVAACLAVAALLVPVASVLASLFAAVLDPRTREGAR
ncbi:ABC transporter permease [Actinocorallia longicatena]|uniref:ABC transporter permease n=1 Tax=Actinocorallia longicatena TaxID=111803 RepID=A0ABP6QLB0_9ACTN